MEIKHYTIGITEGDFEISDYKDYIEKEYQDLDTSKLVPAYLFFLDNNIQYYQFDADNVLLDKESQSYYHLSSTSVIKKVENTEILGFVDSETAEVILI
jgi:hypothetical protein